MKWKLFCISRVICIAGMEVRTLFSVFMICWALFNVSKWKSQPAPAMFVREVVATSDLHQTVRIKLKLLRPLNPTNVTRPILYSYHLTVLASKIVNSVHLLTFFEAFLWRLLIDERKTSSFWEKSFGVIEKYDWCGAKKGHPERFNSFSFSPLQIVSNFFY